MTIYSVHTYTQLCYLNMTTPATARSELTSVPMDPATARAFTDLRATLKATFETFAFYDIHRVELGTPILAKVWHPDYPSNDSEEDTLDRICPTGQPRQMDVLVDAFEVNPAAKIDGYSIAAHATHADSVQEIDYLYDDYEVITWDKPRIATRSHGTLRLKKASRVDFQLGKKSGLFKPLPADLQAIPPLPKTHPIHDEMGKITEKGQMGNLVCVVLDGDYRTRQPKWFVASHQFLHFWTLIVYGPNHASFDKRNTTPQQFRHWLALSVTLATNGYRKWLMGWADHGLHPPEQEMEDRYYKGRAERVREEWSARSHCHIYLALTWMLEYHEFLTEANLPRGRRYTKAHPDGELVIPPLLHWDLPRHFVRNLLRTFGQPSPQAVAWGNAMDAAIHQQRMPMDINPSWFQDEDEEPIPLWGAKGIAYYLSDPVAKVPVA